MCSAQLDLLSFRLQPPLVPRQAMLECPTADHEKDAAVHSTKDAEDLAKSLSTTPSSANGVCFDG